MKWKMKNGEQIEVSKMTKDHAHNTIMFLLKQNDPKDLLNLILIGNDIVKKNQVKKNTEVTLRGDMAQQWNDMNEEHDFMDDMSMFDM
jgi:hypothetical protein